MPESIPTTSAAELNLDRLSKKLEAELTAARAWSAALADAGDQLRADLAEARAHFHDANAALRAICDLLDIDYHRAIEQGQSNPPAAIVEAVRGWMARLPFEDSVPGLVDKARAFDGLALWQAARARMGDHFVEPTDMVKEAQP